MTPDITMCDRKDCPSAERCYRFTAEPNPYRQAYFAPPYPAIVGDRCDYYTKNMVAEAIQQSEEFKQKVKANLEACRVPAEMLNVKADTKLRKSYPVDKQ